MAFLISGCSSGKEAPQTESEVLNEFVRSAPYQYIDLDQAASDTIALKDDNILYQAGAEQQDQPMLGMIIESTFANQQLYIFDFSSIGIYTVEDNGVMWGPHTRQGNGPGEHGSAVVDLVSNRNHIYAADPTNGRINRYTHEMEIHKPIDGLEAMMTEIDLNDDLLISQNNMSLGFTPPNPEQGLIKISRLNNLQDTLATIMPRIIPEGYQPQVYNGCKYSINSQNRIAAIYEPLPWVFLFDEEFNHMRTLILEYSVFDEMDIPPMDFFKPKKDNGFGGTMPFD